MLTLERIAVRLHDIGATAAALGAPWRVAATARDSLLAACADAFGHRLMMDAVRPGGVAAEPATAALAALDEALAAVPPLRRAWPALGALRIEAALALGVPGPIGRAAGRPDPAEPGAALRTTGDLAARMASITDGIEADVDAARTALANLPVGPVFAAPPLRDGEGLAVADGPLGPVWHWVRLAGGTVRAWFAAAPDALLLPAAEQAAAGVGIDDARGAPGVVRVPPGRNGAVTQPAVDDDAVGRLAARIDADRLVRLGRSLAVYPVAAGDCGGCALEWSMLRHAAAGLEQYGVSVRDTPVGADVLLLSGVVTSSLVAPVQRALLAMAEPRWVVAVGACAIDGGVFAGSPAVAGGAAAAVPVDLVIPGCPPTPAAMLAGLRALIAANALALPVQQCDRLPLRPALLFQLRPLAVLRPASQGKDRPPAARTAGRSSASSAAAGSRIDTQPSPTPSARAASQRVWIASTAE